MIPTLSSFFLFFFFNDTATTEIYTLSLHDALPISGRSDQRHGPRRDRERRNPTRRHRRSEHDDQGDRKSTRLNSSHQIISYAVFCLKKKKQEKRKLMKNGSEQSTSIYDTITLLESI